MGWIGKIIGGTVGFMLGGPIGGIAGAVFGNMFDKAPSGEGSLFGGGQQRFGVHSPFGGKENLRPEEQAQMVFFVGVFSMLACVARADGGVSSVERRKVEEFIRRDLRLDPQSSGAAMKIFDTAGSAAGSFEQYAAQFYDQFRTNRQMLELMIDILYQVSVADGRITQQEESLINTAGDLFHFSLDSMNAFRRKYAGSSSSGSTGGSSRSFAVLGLKSEASDSDVKKAYRKLVAEYHPDKIASKGLPEEFVTFASDKFREIQSAYDDIKSYRGF